MMMKKATTLLLTISLGTLFGCGSSTVETSELEGSEQSAASELPEQNIVPEQDPPLEQNPPAGSVGITPILTISDVVSSQESAVVPITVEQFGDIGCYSLKKILYDPNIMLATSVSAGPGVDDEFLVVNTSVPGEIAIGWMVTTIGSAGLFLDDNSTFLKITFEKVAEGVSDIQWNAAIPSDLEPCNTLAKPLDDAPHANFYIDGSLAFE